MGVLNACTLLFSESEGSSDSGVVTDAGKHDFDAPAMDAMSGFARCGQVLAGTIGLFSVDGDEHNGPDMKNSILDGSNGRYVGGFPIIKSTESICNDSLELGRDVAEARYVEFSPSSFSDALSLDFWFKPELEMREETQLEGLLTKDGLEYANGDFGIYLVKNAGGSHQLLVKTAIGGTSVFAVSCSAASGVVLGAWHHLAVSFSTNSTDIFLDGVVINGSNVAISVGEKSATSISCMTSTPASALIPAQNNRNWLWGAGNTNLPFPLSSEENETASDFQGQLDELRFRDQPMSIEDAEETYNEGIAR